MIPGRLFSRLFELGVVVVATSNVAPSELYKDGLNRSLFVPFIAMIEKHMEVLRLDSRTDFRLEKLLAGQKVWFVPADDDAAAALDAGFGGGSSAAREAYRRNCRSGAAALAGVPRAARRRGAVLLPRFCASSRSRRPIISASRNEFLTPSSSTAFR